ncbi:DNA replication protein [Acuticoccus sediminis]|uniref:DNA replication protein n=1 Tax=Acuticoccus sediminis TaxID=2184697 RepID=A0A8B2NSB3_9HYPH|nr:DNA replication protein [Acuticoccus sediminis]
MVTDAVAGRETPLARNAAESPLAWLATRRDRSGQPMISRTQLDAGQRLSADHERGMQRDRVTQSWDVSGVRGESPQDRLTVGEAAQDARRRVRNALDAVGPELSSVLYAVCCEERGLETVEKQHGWPQRCGKVILRLALDRLAQHYGMAPSVSGAARAGLVHWGSADYRPTA